jgi:hypothetical protein
MNKTIQHLTLAMGFLMFFALGDAQAQLPPGRGIPSYNYPTISPYLNLNRRGASPGLNYLTLVRPELEFRAGLQGLNNQVTLNQQAIAEIGNQPLLGTGHQIFFNNTSHYFGNLQGSTAGGRATGGTTGTGQRGGAGNAAGRTGAAAPRQ